MLRLKITGKTTKPIPEDGYAGTEILKAPPGTILRVDASSCSNQNDIVMVIDNPKHKLVTLKSANIHGHEFPHSEAYWGSALEDYVFITLHNKLPLDYIKS